MNYEVKVTIAKESLLTTTERNSGKPVTRTKNEVTEEIKSL